jgi:tRNA pseudouridine38-40 synthase
LQPGRRTVQACVEAALSRVADHRLRVHCAGRTDAGVHALGQVIHIETDAERRERSWVLGANANLPRDVSVVWARRASSEFHARYSATSRCYRYVIFNRSGRPGLLSSRVTWECRCLDESRMRTAAASLIGEHDFSGYRARDCQARSPVRTLYSLEVARIGPFISIEVEANGFLHHMVRNITGVLMAIGRGEADVGWAREVLERRNRALGGVTAPPDGLYLTKVRYADDHGVPIALDMRLPL